MGYFASAKGAGCLISISKNGSPHTCHKRYTWEGSCFQALSILFLEKTYIWKDGIIRWERIRSPSRPSFCARIRHPENQAHAEDPGQAPANPW
jgi:hypothetical protein